jgi:hypothetical protein
MNCNQRTKNTIAIPKLPVEAFNIIVATCRNLVDRCEALFRMVKSERDAYGMVPRKWVH